MSEPSIWDPNATGTPVVRPQTFLVEQTFYATEGQTTFTISAFLYTPGTGTLRVYVNGARITGIQETSSSTFAMPVGASCKAGDKVFVEALLEEIAASQQTFETEQFVATAGQQSFDILNSPGRTIVFRNGAMQTYLVDYTSTGEAIVMVEEMLEGDTVDVVKFATFVSDGAASAAELVNDTDPAKGAALVGYKGRTVFDKLNELISAKDAPFNAVGDGITDDTIALQSFFDYIFDNNIDGFIPAGVYKTTSPLYVYGSNTDTLKLQTRVFGAGRDNTIIKKYGNTTATDGGVSNVDSVILISNNYVKAGGTITDYFDGLQTACYGVELYDLGLEFNGDYLDPTRVIYGMWSTGLFYANFENLRMRHFQKHIVTTVWNCYCNYRRIRFDRPDKCIEALSSIIGNTTAHIDSCHANGPDVAAYDLKMQGGVITNCPIDGGAGYAYKFVDSDIVIIGGYSESPSANGTIYADNSKVLMVNGDIEAVRLTGKVNYTAINNSKITVQSGRLYSPARDGYALISPGQPHSADVSSRVIYDKVDITSEFTVAPNYSISLSEKKTLIDVNRLSTARNKFMQYVSGAIDPANYPVLTVTEDAGTGRIIVSSLGNRDNGTRAIMFSSPINLDGYSRMKMVATLSNTHNSNLYAMGVGLSKILIADGTVTPGVSLPSDTGTYGEVDKWTNGTDIVFDLDVSMRYGDFYVYLFLPANTPSAYTVAIKSLEFLQ